jgi:hypothetical protein
LFFVNKNNGLPGPNEFIGLRVANSWFFFLLFLMFLGGIIIIVIYMTSLAANEKASVSFSGIRGILFLSLRMLLFKL